MDFIDNKKSLIQYDLPIQAPKIDYVRKEISVEDAYNGAPLRDILNSIFPPCLFQKDGQDLVQYVSALPAIRTDVVKIQTQLEQELQQQGALETGVCPIRSRLYSQCFDEVIRQVTIENSPRGLLLVQLRDEMQRMIEEYKILIESTLAYGTRKIEKETGNKTKMMEENKRLKEEILNIKQNNIEIEKEIENRKEKFEKEIEYLQQSWAADIEQMKKEINIINQQILDMMVSK
ncbi:28 kDa inner dynein arm light chain, axonemal [Tritrichomonas musculus]|uniref:28 kDa inner dynein arm light chain, axonemal n=1 Tax=Tritrichomonas musculus TaxID=1915356 RepID=A0ABR2K3J2_9EUKA